MHVSRSVGASYDSLDHSEVLPIGQFINDRPHLKSVIV